MDGFFRIQDLGLVLFTVVAAYFSFRYFALKHALRETALELTRIQGDLLQNRILRLPLPDKELERLMKSVNGMLEQIRREHLAYEKREREFRQQIENISHDLRTPLTVILGYLKWLRSPAGNTSFRLPETLDILERSARSMEHLVSQFYAFSCLNGPDFALETERLDISRLLRESLAEHCRLLEKPGFRLDCRLPEHPVAVQGNRDALERVFANLIQNAARYAHSYLDIRMSDSCGQVLICFENDSLEIREHDVPNLFDRFYRNDGSRGKGGSGLGLPIAKSLAEAMGGSLTARALPESEPSVVCFTFALPAETAPAPPCPGP
ncbi:MAG: HAMP domain-containing histidine kinase [Lachnospiraceae bacterium]|nr:HAMP domain-containing histidine kinase [Lachnospiraceae bacterium]